MTEDEIVRWHHKLNGHEFEKALGVVKYRGAWCAVVYGELQSSRQDDTGTKTETKTNGTR